MDLTLTRLPVSRLPHPAKAARRNRPPIGAAAVDYRRRALAIRAAAHARRPKHRAKMATRKVSSSSSQPPTAPSGGEALRLPSHARCQLRRSSRCREMQYLRPPLKGGAAELAAHQTTSSRCLEAQGLLASATYARQGSVGEAHEP